MLERFDFLDILREISVIVKGRKKNTGRFFDDLALPGKIFEKQLELSKSVNVAFAFQQRSSIFGKRSHLCGLFLLFKLTTFVVGFILSIQYI